MSEQKRQGTVRLDVSREAVHLTELKLAAFEDPERARDVADDCLRLFEAADGEDFSSVRNERWYERLWSTMVSGNPRRQAEDCAARLEAQALLLRLLQAHAETNAKSNALVALLARRLRDVKGGPNTVAAEIIRMAEKILRLEKILPGVAASGAVDPGHTSTWNQTDRLLLYKTMVIAAAADGYLAPEEEVLLEHKLRELDLDPDHTKLATEFEATPHPIDEELEGLESYPIRLSIYRHAMGVVHSDGVYDPQERAYMERLTRVLKLEFDDTEKVKDAFAPCQDKVSHAQVVELLTRDVAAEAGGDAAAALSVQLDEIASVWIDYTAVLLSEALTAPILQRFEQYGALDNVPVVAFVETLDPQGIEPAVDTTAGLVKDMARSLVSDLAKGFTLPPALLGDQIDDAWQGMLGDKDECCSIAGELTAAGEGLRKALPADAPQVTRALGFAGAARQGPLGWAASVISREVESAEQRGKLESAASRWDAAVSKLADATHRWQQACEERMRDYLVKVIDAVRTIVGDTADVATAAFPVLRMFEHMEEVRETRGERGHAAGPSQCPKCGRSYPSGATRCAICEVRL